jgi:type VI protein secretion system component VasK
MSAKQEREALGILRSRAASIITASVLLLSVAGQHPFRSHRVTFIALGIFGLVGAVCLSLAILVASQAILRRHAETSSQSEAQTDDDSADQRSDGNNRRIVRSLRLAMRWAYGLMALEAASWLLVRLS